MIKHKKIRADLQVEMRALLQGDRFSPLLPWALHLHQRSKGLFRVDLFLSAQSLVGPVLKLVLAGWMNLEVKSDIYCNVSSALSLT